MQYSISIDNSNKKMEDLPWWESRVVLTNSSKPFDSVFLLANVLWKSFEVNYQTVAKCKGQHNV